MVETTIQVVVGMITQITETEDMVIMAGVTDLRDIQEIPEVIQEMKVMVITVGIIEADIEGLRMKHGMFRLRKYQDI